MKAEEFSARAMIIAEMPGIAVVSFPEIVNGLL